MKTPPSSPHLPRLHQHHASTIPKSFHSKPAYIEGPTWVLSGRLDVSIDALLGPHTAICTYDRCIAVPPPSRKKESIEGVLTSGVSNERPNRGLRSSTAMSRTLGLSANVQPTKSRAQNQIPIEEEAATRRHQVRALCTFFSHPSPSRQSMHLTRSTFET
jgi:hypothetical protein